MFESYLRRFFLATLLLICATGEASDYRISTPSFPRTQVYFSTPKGWRGWKDEEQNLERMDVGSRKLIETDRLYGCAFLQPGCPSGIDCPILEVRAFHLEPWDPHHLAAQLNLFVDSIKRDHQNSGGPDPKVTKLRNLDAGRNGRLDLWSVRCSFYDDFYFVALVKKDTLVQIYLRAQDATQIRSKLGGLTALVRSLRFVNP
jgi:hypothetical protein